jgi:hypothetical protein
MCPSEERSVTTIRRVRIEVVQSSLDGGYYAEVWETDTGREVRSTEVYRTAGEAIGAARKWATDQGYEIA